MYLLNISMDEIKSRYAEFIEKYFKEKMS
jgi:hypothetical protein